MSRRTGSRWLIVGGAVLALLTGCGGAPGTTGPEREPTTPEGTTDATTEATGPETETFTDPATEAVDETEDPGGGGDDEVAVELPGLPIGGFHAVDPADPRVRCVVVNWSGPPDVVPPEANLVITGIAVTPTDAYGWSGDGCNGFGPCLDSPGVLDAGGQCGVRVDQVAAVPDGRGVLSVTTGALTCAPDVTAGCEQFAAEVEAAPPDDIEWDDALTAWDQATDSPTTEDGTTGDPTSDTTTSDATSTGDDTSDDGTPDTSESTG